MHRSHEDMNATKMQASSVCPEINEHPQAIGEAANLQYMFSTARSTV